MGICLILRKFVTFALALSIFFFILGCNQNTEIQDLGSRIQDFPQRIVSLSPAITEELYLLGVEDRIVGTTVYCDRPSGAKEKEKVGTVINVDLEKIVILRPDLILATSLTNPGQMEKLKSLGIRVISFPLYKNKNFSQICKQFMEVGRIVGRDEAAKEIVRQMKGKIDSISKKVKGLSKPKVFVQIGARPLFTITKDSFIQDLIILAGGINITRQAKSGLYSREDVIRQNPGVIIIVTMGIVGEEERKIWKRFKTLDAARNDRIYIIDSNKTCSPTPVSFVEALEEIAGFLHPEKGD